MKYKPLRKWITLLITVIMTLVLCTGCTELNALLGNGNSTTATATADTVADPVVPVIPSGELKVSYLDVGQADAILLQQGEHFMLIDAGNNGDADLVTSYLTGQGVSKLDYLFGSHPHEDHIGSTDIVVDAFDIGTIYMPKVSATTKTFEDVMMAISNKGLSINSPVVGEVFQLGDAVCTILGPVAPDPDNLNTYSIVLKVVYGNNAFLFTGDAEADNELAMVKNAQGNPQLDLSSDVLKIGHHGSSSSSNQQFISIVNPSTSVISVGEGNSYSHPTPSTLDRLTASGINTYRTDLNGTIVAVSDGNVISFSTERGDFQ